MKDTEVRVTNAVLGMLQANLPFEVYDHRAPDDRVFPYAVLYRIPGGGSSGPALHDPDADVTVVYQVDGVGSRRDQAELAASMISDVMLGYSNGAPKYVLGLPGTLRECGRMRNDTLGGVEPEGPSPNEVFTVPGRYEVSVTPS